MNLFRENRFPRLSLILLLLGLYVFAYVPVPDSLDGEALLAVAASLVRRGSADMNVIAYTDWVMPPNAGMGQLGADGEVYSKKGIAPSLALVPFVFAADLLQPLTARAASMLLNPLITALTAAVIYSILRRFGFSTWVSWLTSFLYGAATMAFVYTGTLFGEPLAAFAIASAVLAFVRWRETESPRDLLLLGASFALLIGINLVYIALAPLGGLFLLLSSLSRVKDNLFASLRLCVNRLFFFSLPIVAALIATAVFNHARFGSPFNGGYRFAEGEGFIYPIPLGLFGMFLSAYRGLFWYNPILFAALPGAILLLRQRSTAVLSAAFALCLAAGVAIAFAGWWSWHGGIVWGPRFLLPALPVFALCLAPVVERVIASRRRLVRTAFISLVVVSIAVQLLGVLIPYLPHYAYLKDNFFNPDPNALVGSLDDRVLTDPALSPIVGHAQLLLSGFPLQPGWISRSFDPAYLFAAALLIAPGILLLLSPSPVQKFFAPSRLLFNRFYPFISVSLCLLFSLFLVAYRGSVTQTERESLANLAAAIGDADSVVLATSYYGAALIDLETRAHVVSMNAPTSQYDERAQSITASAWVEGEELAYVTWMPAADQQDWFARAAFELIAFVDETNIDHHRVLRFVVKGIRATDPADERFGDIRLEAIGIETLENYLLVALAWGADIQPAGNYSWFVHVLDADGNILAQQDRSPLSGFAPSTSRWIPPMNAYIKDMLAFEVGNLERATALRIGWIDPATGERLPTFNSDGTRLPDDFVVIPIGN